MLIFEKISFKIYDYLLELSTKWVQHNYYFSGKLYLLKSIVTCYYNIIICEFILFVAFLCSLLFFMLKKSKIIL